MLEIIPLKGKIGLANGGGVVAVNLDMPLNAGPGEVRPGSDVFRGDGEGEFFLTHVGFRYRFEVVGGAGNSDIAERTTIVMHVLRWVERLAKEVM